MAYQSARTLRKDCALDFCPPVPSDDFEKRSEHTAIEDPSIWLVVDVQRPVFAQPFLKLQVRNRKSTGTTQLAVLYRPWISNSRHDIRNRYDPMAASIFLRRCLRLIHTSVAKQLNP